MSKKKHKKRVWKIGRQPIAVPIWKWDIVLAELKPGSTSVGVRFNKENTVHFFEMDKTPDEAATIAADVARGAITLQDIAEYDWRAVELPDVEQVSTT